MNNPTPGAAGSTGDRQFSVEQPVARKISRLISNEKVKKALQAIQDDQAETLKEQKELVVIEAPTFHEEKRAAFYAEKLRQLGLEQVTVDQHNNVFGKRAGKGRGPTVLIEGHLDIVFAAGTDLTPKEKDGRIYAPGIGDDTRALAENLCLLRALDAARIETCGDIIFAGTAAEEGLGAMSGMKALLASHPEIAATISIDTSSPDIIVYNATGIINYEVTYSGCGGHAYGAFGTPSALHAAARAIAKLADMKPPASPKTTYTVSLMTAGHAIHAIAQTAVFTINMRSDDATELARLEQQALQLFQAGADEENARWSDPAGVIVAYRKITDIPAGSQPADSIIVQTAWEAIRTLGQTPRLLPGGCTNANMAIHAGIPAVTLGRGGHSGGVHTVGEWFDPADAYKSIQNSLLVLLALTGVQGDCESVLSE